MSLRSDVIGAGAGVLIVAGIAFYVWKRGGLNVARDVVGAVGNAAAGTVVGVGELIGIPPTNNERCAAAIAAGDTWAASLYCPAAEFAAYLLNSPAAVAPARERTAPQLQTPDTYLSDPSWDYVTNEDLVQGELLRAQSPSLDYSRAFPYRRAR